MNRKFILLIFLTLLFSCSSSNDNVGLNETEQKIVGVWDESANLKGNTYTYKADKTAVYVNYRFTGTETIVTTYTGAWDLVEGNMLIENYLFPNKPWNDNWKKDPILKHKIEFVSGSKLKLTNFYNSQNTYFLYKH